MSTPSKHPNLKRLSANRANAKLATGPKSLAGKRVASQNAIRHRLSVPLPADVLAPLQAQVAGLLLDSGLAAASADDLAGKIIEFERNMAVFRQAEGQRLAADTPKTMSKSKYKGLPSPQKFLAKFNARLQQQAKVNFDRYLRRARNQLLKALHAVA